MRITNYREFSKKMPTVMIKIMEIIYKLKIGHPLKMYTSS